MSQSLGFIFVLLSGTCFGFLGIFGRLAFNSGLSVAQLLVLRFLVASVILAAFLLVFKRHLLVLTLRQTLISACLGSFGYAVFSTLYFEAIKGISVPLAALLLFTFPIFVNLASHFILKDRMTKRQVLSLFIACTGLVILLWGPLVVNSLTAVVCALAAAVAYAIYVLVSGQLQKHVAPLSSSLYVMISAGLALFIFHRPDLPFQQLTIAQWGIIAGISVVSTIAPLTLFLAGLQRLSSSKASIVVMIEPVVAALAAWLILGEQLSGMQLCGAILVMIALVLSVLK